ncbi:MAG: pilus assembly protein [Actinomycetia bacterium]|nr:pilus assembly protein [Actinomycetes bacterium]
MRLCNDDEGTAIVESALVLPIFTMFVFAILEFGLVFQHVQTVGNMTRVGARTAAIAGDEADADLRILAAVAEAGEAMPVSDIHRIVVFSAVGPESTIPEPCKTSNSAAVLASNECNVYLPSDIGSPASSFGCGVGDLDTPWCPTTRDVTAGGRAFIGIWVEAERQYVTGIFGDSVTVSDSVILRIEPDLL